MKQIIIGIFIFLSINLSAQSEVKFLNAFGEVPLSSVANLLAEKLTVCIYDNVFEVSRAEAITKLNAFINDQDMSNKKILHTGKSSDEDSSFKVARIKTDSGSVRVFAYAEMVNGTSVVKEIRIDRM